MISKDLIGGVFNLTNSIMGVSILAMPLCFKLCGVVFGLFLSLLATGLSLASCKMLLKASKASSRSSFETLGQFALGRFGKLAVEVCVIGLLLGSCVAYLAIIGDIVPHYAARYYDMNVGEVRNKVLIVVGICVIFPLSLMRNVASLSPLNAVSLFFYTVFMLSLLVTAIQKWMSSSPSQAPIALVDFSGFLPTLPIFSLAYTCQFALFAVYEGLPSPNIKAMNSVINYSITLACALYSSVGILGYISYSHVEIDGDLLNNFPDGNILFDMIKLGFAASIIVSFPITVYPSRAALNTLIFNSCTSSPAPSYSTATAYAPLQEPSAIVAIEKPIPTIRFFVLTAAIVCSSLLVAIAIPDVATILSLTGSTTGTGLAYMLPASIFLRLVSAELSSKEWIQGARLIFLIGIVCCVFSTLVVLQEAPGDHSSDSSEKHNYVNQNIPQGYPGDSSARNSENPLFSLP